MKKFLFVLMMALHALSLVAQRNDKLFITKSLSGSSIKDVSIETSGGNISVTGQATDPRVEVYVHQNNNSGGLTKEEIQKKIDEDYTFKISVENNKLNAVARPKRQNINWKKAINISFRVFVPGDISTELRTSGGNIELEKISGKQHFTTSGGNLRIDDLSGSINGRTSGGNIDLMNSKGGIDLQTSGGNIHAGNCTGDINLETSGGSLQLNALNGKIKANTSGGNVDGQSISGELLSHTSGGNVDLKQLSCSLETSTSGGNINVSIKELGKYITINNSGGDIDLEMPGNKGVDLKLSAQKIKTGTLNNFTGKSDEDEIKGTLNGGGIPVSVLAGSGRINLSFN